jgi:hypothetical protein
MRSSGTTRLNDKYGNILAIIIKTMPISMKDRLLTNIKVIFPGDLKYTDSFKEGFNNQFPCAHYTWYNRFSKQVRYFEMLLLILLNFFLSARMKTSLNKLRNTSS